MKQKNGIFWDVNNLYKIRKTSRKRTNIITQWKASLDIHFHTVFQIIQFNLNFQPINELNKCSKLDK